MLVVTPNLCFDRTLWVDTFVVGTVSRPSRASLTAGGKGVNVVRTLRDLGAPGRLVGFLPAGQGAELDRLLREEGTELRAVPVAGDVRGATIVVERDGRATVLNEPGPVVGAADLDRLLAAIEDELASQPTPAVVVCSGSLPPGLPDDAYGRVCDLVRAHGGITVVDAARDALAEALRFAPDAVTPNLAEAENLLDGALTEHSHQGEDADRTRAAALAAAHRLCGLGARRAIVTAGSHGVAAVDPAGRELWVPAYDVAAVNPIGAGDSFVGGLSAGLDATGDWTAAIRYAVAVAGAAVEQPDAGRVDAERVRALSTGAAVLR